MLLKPREIPGRLAAGAYILHSGIEKWASEEDRAKALHGMAAKAYPFLADVPPATFVRALATAEIATGALILAPFVPAAVAGAALSGFAASLLVMYARTPALRNPGSIWPSPAGIAVSKDVWMLGIGAGLLVDAWARRRAS